MNPISLLGLSWDALRERRLRAVLTIAMVTIGAALVTGLNGMSAGMNQYMLGQFGMLGAKVIIVFPATGAAGSSIRMTESIVSMVRGVDGVSVVEPFIQQVATLKAGGSSRSVIVAGVDQQKLPLIFPALSLQNGRFAPPYDAVSMVVGYNVAYPPGESKPFAALGQSVTVEFGSIQGGKLVTVKRAFRVGGVLANLGTIGIFVPIDRMGFISLSAANSLFGRAGNYDGLYVIAVSEARADDVVAGLRRLLGNNVEVFSSKTLIQLIQNVLGSLQIFIGGIASVSLIVASVGIFAGLYTSVLERTWEIGLLKSLGFRNWMILMLFLNEAILIGMIGGTVGNGLGIVLAHGLSVIVGQARGRIVEMVPEETMRPSVSVFPPLFTMENLLLVWLFAVGLSLFAGVYPAWRASRLDPVVALRKE